MVLVRGAGLPETRLRRRPDLPRREDRRLALRRRIPRIARPRIRRQDRRRGGSRTKNLGIIADPSYENLCRFVMEYADGIILASDAVTPEIIELVRNSGKPAPGIPVARRRGLFRQLQPIL